MTIDLLTHRFVRLSIAAVVVAVTATEASAQQGVTYEVVASFDGIFVNGMSPGTLLEGRDGNLYGTTESRGIFGAGTLFRIDAAGVLTTLHHFGGLQSVRGRRSLIQATDGSFYGTTEGGGTFGQGTVFRMDTAGALTTLHNFSEADGTQPTILVEGSAGRIFGVTVGIVSTVFQLNPGGGVTTLHRFDRTTEGSSPSSLIQAADGNLYGTSGGGPFDQGTVFRLDSSGTLTTLHAFSGPDGSSPLDLIQGSDGDFYGVTAEGFSHGTIFKIDAGGAFTTLHHFPPGVFSTVLIQGTDGSFYGSSPPRQGAPAADERDGFIFRFDPGGTPTTLHRFTGVDGTSYGTLIQASDGSLYGTKQSGGSGRDAGGTIFKLDLVGTFTVLHHFGRNPGPAYPLAHVTEGSDGRLYGTTVAGGLSDVGTVFTIEPSGAARVLHSFTRDAFTGGQGGEPRAGLVRATDGLLYGATSSGGGNNLGTVFAIDATGALTTRHTFLGNPHAVEFRNGLIQATDGRLYGTTIYAAFRMPLSGPASTLTALNGVSSAALIEASDGKFYGTTSLLFAGAEFGTIFSLDAAGSLTTLHRFDTDGRHPRSRVIEGLNGSLYGTTSQGGTFGYGTVFKFDPAGTLTTLHHFAGADGANPYAGLLAASDGRFYGTTRNGGAFGNGTIFTIDTTGTLTTLHSFAPSDGMFPVADLIQASDGHVYGTTVSGGPYNGGVVFRVRLATSPPDQYVEIVSRNSGQCLDVSGASTDAAASVIQWPCHGGPNQQWRLEPAGGGAFRIIARHSGQVLDVYGGFVDDVTPIIQWPLHGGDNQVWTLEPASDGYMRIVARHSGKALDVEFASADDGARVIQYTPHSGANQQWLLRPVE